MSRTSLRSLFATSCLAAVLAAGSLPATGEAAPAETAAADRTFGSAVDVNVVNLDVFVTDRDGKPVTGLTPDDFTVQFDGDRVKAIEFFDEIQLPSVLATPGAAAPAAAGDPQAAPAAPASEPLRMVVVIDNRNILPANRNRILGELRSFITPRLGPGFEVMVLTQDQSLNVRQAFSPDAAAFGRTLDEVAELPPAHFEREAERQSVLNSLQNVIRLLAEGSTAGNELAVAETDSAMRQITVYADSARRDVAATVESLKQVVRALGSLPGRKALVYVSDGLPLRPGDSLATALQNTLRDGRTIQPAESGLGSGRGGGQDDGGTDTPSLSSTSSGRSVASQAAHLRNELTPYDTTNLFLELTAWANARRVTFYPVNGAGGDIAALGADVRSDVGQVGTPSTFLVADQLDVRDSLRLMAEETGGRALVGGTDVDGWLGGVEQDLSSFYSMGFVAPKLADGKLHKVKIKVKGRGRDVRYRQSFVARGAEETQPDRTSAALLLGVEDNPHGIAVDVEGQSAREDGSYQVALLLRVPLAKVAFTPAGEKQKAVLKVCFSVAGADGRVTPVASLPLAIEVPADQLEAARGQYYGARLPVAMSAGEQRFAIGIWDAAGGLGSYITSQVEVGSDAAEASASGTGG
ncbi:MAG: VWA domain-containing protein [Acidobacteria bacterium]|nr:VWA domain-containing protein [Acidobacteriota bacterium]